MIRHNILGNSKEKLLSKLNEKVTGEEGYKKIADHATFNANKFIKRS